MANLLGAVGAGPLLFQLISMDTWEGLAFALDSMTYMDCSGKEAPYLGKAYLRSTRLIISPISCRGACYIGFLLVYQATMMNDLN